MRTKKIGILSKLFPAKKLSAEKIEQNLGKDPWDDSICLPSICLHEWLIFMGDFSYPRPMDPMGLSLDSAFLGILRCKDPSEDSKSPVVN